MPYTDVWSSVQANLKGSISIANWTAAHGYSGEPFTAKILDRNSIIVTGPGISAPRPVRRAEIEDIYAVWDAYTRKDMPRSKLPQTFQSKYIISLLRWLQDHKQLPQTRMESSSA